MLHLSHAGVSILSNGTTTNVVNDMSLGFESIAQPEWIAYRKKRMGDKYDLFLGAPRVGTADKREPEARVLMLR